MNTLYNIQGDSINLDFKIHSDKSNIIYSTDAGQQIAFPIIETIKLDLENISDSSLPPHRLFLSAINSYAKYKPLKKKKDSGHNFGYGEGNMPSINSWICKFSQICGPINLPNLLSLADISSSVLATLDTDPYVRVEATNLSDSTAMTYNVVIARDNDDKPMIGLYPSFEDCCLSLTLLNGDFIKVNNFAPNSVSHMIPSYLTMAGHTTTPFLSSLYPYFSKDSMFELYSSLSLALFFALGIVNFNGTDLFLRNDPHGELWQDINNRAQFFVSNNQSAKLPSFLFLACGFTRSLEVSTKKLGIRLRLSADDLVKIHFISSTAYLNYTSSPWQTKSKLVDCYSPTNNISIYEIFTKSVTHFLSYRETDHSGYILLEPQIATSEPRGNIWPILDKMSNLVKHTILQLSPSMFDKNNDVVVNI